MGAWGLEVNGKYGRSSGERDGEKMRADARRVLELGLGQDGCRSAPMGRLLHIFGGEGSISIKLEGLAGGTLGRGGGKVKRWRLRLGAETQRVQGSTV